MVYTETVVHAAPEQFVADAPYQLAIVSLEEGGRLTVRVEGERVVIGDRVEFVEDRRRDFVLPQSVKVLLYYIGKARDTHANAMAEEYIKRSTRFAKCEMREIHPLRFDPWAKHPRRRRFCSIRRGARWILPGSFRWSKRPSGTGAMWSS